MDATLLRRPSAVIPVAMSVAALATVMGYAAMFGDCPSGRRGNRGPRLAAAHGRTGAGDRVVRHSVVPCRAPAGNAGSCPPGRRGGGRDVPGLVVPVVIRGECHAAIAPGDAPRRE